MSDMNETISIVPISEEYIESYHECLEAVAGERKYLGYISAPSLEDTRENILAHIQRNTPRYIAIKDNTVIGWCEVLPNQLEGFRHSGKINTMGVSVGFRGQGIGVRLMKATLSAAEQYGLERVELLVYASNLNAIGFYEKIGFVCEGTKKKARKLDDEYDDVHVMAIFLNPEPLNV
jgi:ribosomal protein S18 acetylase RimI-like enzyme